MEGEPVIFHEDGVEHMSIRKSAAMPILAGLADRLDAHGAHAMADVLDEVVALLVRRAQIPLQQQQVAQQQQMQQQQQQQQQLADRFLNIHTEMLNATRLFSNPATIPSGMKRLLDAARELGFAANALKQSVTSTTPTATTSIPAATTAVPGGPAFAAALPELVSLADRLDAEGRHVLAEAVDMAAGILAKFGGEEKPPIRPGNRTPLSTRYCPDHTGVQAIRVDEHVYQCPMDGRLYDYEGGYTDYSGQQVLGGSVAAQTPMSSPVLLPQRLYDSRQNVINTLN